MGRQGEVGGCGGLESLPGAIDGGVDDGQGLGLVDVMTLRGRGAPAVRQRAVDHLRSCRGGESGDQGEEGELHGYGVQSSRKDLDWELLRISCYLVESWSGMLCYNIIFQRPDHERIYTQAGWAQIGTARPPPHSPLSLIRCRRHHHVMATDDIQCSRCTQPGSLIVT